MTPIDPSRLFVLLAGTLLASLSGSAQSSGPVAHWAMNGGPADISGNGHHGTLHNVTPTTGRAGVPNSAYYFSGNNSYISIPDAQAWNVTQYTIGAVVKPTAFNTDLCQGNYVIARGGQTVGRWALAFHDNLSNDCNTIDTSQFVFINYPGMALYSSTSSAQLQYTPAISTNTWYTVVATYDGTQSKIYVNGVLKSTASYVANMMPTTDSVIIGRERVDPSSPYPFPFIGAIDDIRFYNRVLTAAEITDYSIPVPATPPAGGGDTLVTGIRPESGADLFQLVPNPAQGAATLTLAQPQAAPVTIRVFDLLGKQVYEAPMAGSSARIDLSAFPAGVYMLRLQVGTDVWVRRLTKE